MPTDDDEGTPIWRARSSLIFYGILAVLGAAAAIGFQAWPIAVSFAIGLVLMVIGVKVVEGLVYGPKDD